MKAGISTVPYNLFGGFFYSSMFLTFLVYFNYVYPLMHGKSLFEVFLYTVTSWIFLPLLLSLALALIMYIYLDLSIFNRTKKMEAVLSEFLRFVAENLKGGMSFEKALWSSIRPEFGVLSSEVKLAAKKVMTGQDVEEALTEFTSKYDSPIMKRSFDLIVEGMKGGGQISEIIARVVENIEDTKELKAEMSATNLSYVIFITIIVIFVTPLLFTLSFQFLIILEGFGTKIGPALEATSGSTGGGPSIGIPLKFSEVSIQPETFKAFSRYALTIISIFSAMIVSIINTGNIKGGVKYIPFFIIGSLLFHMLLMSVFGNIFGGLFV
ncbi:MAG: type II secretion system F family protein [bacterium]|nr:type II secretion system F family protein [bacterium]